MRHLYATDILFLSPFHCSQPEYPSKISPARSVIKMRKKYRLCYGSTQEFADSTGHFDIPWWEYSPNRCTTASRLGGRVRTSGSVIVIGMGVNTSGDFDMPVPGHESEGLRVAAAGQTWRAPFGRRHAREHQAAEQRGHAGKFVPGVQHVAHTMWALHRRERRSRDVRAGGVASRIGEVLAGAVWRSPCQSRAGAWRMGRGGTRSARAGAVRQMEGMVSARCGVGGTAVGRRLRTGVMKNSRTVCASGVGENAPTVEFGPERIVR
ncbi:hypothetical protein B0H14DRAFT_3572912 [Mycena olivaceomarginata]|nr:hypothetical protein B0H14DRAFT_3572912 [Mycena olivaceomarginata]